MMTAVAERRNGGVLERAVDGLRAQGHPVTVLGFSELGETAGAAFVAGPGGECVLTVSALSLTRMEQTGETLVLARDRGLAVPRIHLLSAVEGVGVAVVQDRLPGRRPTVVDPGVIDLIVMANERFAELLLDHPEVPSPVLNVGSGGSVPWRQTLDGFDSRSRGLLRRIEQVDPVGHRADADLVHPDLTVSNVLLDADVITGIVDWNDGAFRGDRHFALVKLLFDSTWEAAASAGGRHRIQPAALDHLERWLRQNVSGDRLTAYWAHWTATMLHWTIRSGDRRAIELHLDLGERGPI